MINGASEMYISTFTHSSDALLLVAKDGTVFNSSNEFFRMSGLSSAQVIGKKLQDVTQQFTKHESLKNRLHMACQKVFKIDSTILLEPIVSENQKSHNEHIWYKQTLSPIPVDGVIEYVLYKVEIDNFNLTPIRFKELEIENLQYERLVSSAKDYAIFMIDATGIITTWNRGAEHLKQYSADDVIGKHFSMLYSKEDIAAELPEKILYTAVKDGHSEEEGWRIRKDGSRFWANVTTTPVLGTKGELIGYAKITKDLTERKLAEEKTLEAMNESSRLKSMFLANMSHEIRTPVNGIIGITELLEKTTSLDPTQKKLVHLAKTCGVGLLTIINDILDFSKIEANKMDIFPQEISLNDFLDEIRQLGELLLTDTPLTFNFDMLNVPLKTTIKCDQHRLRQIFLNCLSNSKKFTRKGLVNCKILIIASDKQKITARFEISDTGIGISAENQKKLFKSFTQINPVIGGQGTGLGLSITKRLVELMDGRIWVESKIDQGTSVFFEISFPRSQNIPTKPVIVATEKPIKKKVLVVDDNSINLLVIKKMVETIGCEVFTASNGEEAIKTISEQTFDLILMDLQMPIMDGLEATAKIRASGNSVIIIAVTADAFESERVKCIQAGMNDYLPKPVTFVDITQMLRRYLT